MTPGPAAPRPLHVAIALATVYVVWGSTYLAIKIAIEDIPPMTMAAARFAVAGAILYAWSVRGGTERPTWRQWRAAAVAGGLMLVGGNGAVTLAEEHLDSGIAALLVATVPLWMALFGRVGFGERLPRAAVGGLLLGFAGVAVLVDPTGTGGLHLPSAVLVIAGAAAWGYGSLRSRVLDLPGRPLVSTAMQMLAAAVLFLAAAAGRGEFAELDVAAVGAPALAALAYLTVAGSLAAFSAYVWLLRNAPTSLVSTYAYVNPVVAVLLGWLVLAEPVTGRTLLAGAVIVVAVAVIVRSRRAGQPGRATSASWRDRRTRSPAASQASPSSSR